MQKSHMCTEPKTWTDQMVNTFLKFYPLLSNFLIGNEKVQIISALQVSKKIEFLESEGREESS